MGRITNISLMFQRAGKIAEKVAKKQLSTTRDGSSNPMDTFGTLSESIEAKIKTQGFLVELVLEAADHGLLLDKGFRNIPFTKPKSKKASKKKPSQYILALTRWAAKKYTGGDWNAAKKIAFAIAHKQKDDNKAPANKGWIKEIKDDLDKKLSVQMSIDTMMAVNLDVESILNIKIP